MYMINNERDGFFPLYYMKNSEEGGKLLENHAHLFRDQRVSEKIIKLRETAEIQILSSEML